jgi:hypothetical protein
MKKILLFLLLVSSYVSAQKVTEETVLFATADASLTAEAIQTLKQMLSQGRADQMHFRLAGHTDQTGSADYNLDLSERRVSSVSKWLMDNGVPASNITTGYFGKAEPVVRDLSPEGLAKNRRVEMIVSKAGAFNRPGVAGIYSEDFVRPIFPSIQIPSETFVVNASKANTLECADGTVIRIPEGAFVNIYGQPVSTEATVKYQTYRTSAECLASGIPMQIKQNGRIGHFETGGMFSLTAEADGIPLGLRPGAQIEMDFVSGGDPDFNFYFLDQGSTNWLETNENMTNVRFTDAALKQSPEFNLSSAVIRYLQLTALRQGAHPPHVTLGELFYNYFPVGSLMGESSREARKDLRHWSELAPYRVSVKRVRLPRGQRVTLFTLLDETSRNENPELSAYRGLKWIYEGPLTAKELRKQFSGVKFSNLRITPDSDPTRITLELKGMTEVTPIGLARLNRAAYAHFETEKDMTVNEREMKKRHAAYAKSMTKQELAHLRQSNGSARKIARGDMIMVRNAFNEVKQIMNEEESKMELEEWDDYCEEFKPEFALWLSSIRSSRFAEGAGATFVRSLTMDKIGIYNIDIVKQLKYPVQSNPVFFDANQAIVLCSKTYLVDRNLSGVMWQEGGSVQTVDPINIRAWVIESVDGAVYKLTAEEIDIMRSTKRVRGQLQVELIQTAPESVNELEELLSMAN